MPVYEYRCGQCKKKFTVTMSLKDHDSRRAKCPKCGGKKVVQLISTFSAITSKKS
jgi:putative FmdB family regulatory protein